MLGEALGSMLSLMGPLLGGGLSELQDLHTAPVPGHGGPGGGHGHYGGFTSSMSSMQTTSTGKDGLPVTTITTERTVNGETTTEIRVLRNGVEIESRVEGGGGANDGRPLQLGPAPFGTVRRPEVDTRQADTPPQPQPPAEPSGPVGAIASLLGRLFD